VDDQEAHERVARVEALLDEVESLPDPHFRDKATEMVQALLDMYGEGLARVMQHARDAGAEPLTDTLAADELVSHLLLLHDLHPIPVETRVLGALDEVRPYLESHGGNVEFLGVTDGVVRLRMEGSCSGCPSSTVTLKLAIEEAVFKAAPDVEAVEAEGVEDGNGTGSPGGGIELPVLQVGGTNGASPAGGAAEPGWSTVGDLPDFVPGRKLIKEVSGERIMFLKLDEDLYAYRPRCPGCWKSLANATLGGSELTCAACGTRYDVRRAGRCPDAPELALDPVPLLVNDAGLVKVAVGSPAAA